MIASNADKAFASDAMDIRQTKYVGIAWKKRKRKRENESRNDLS